MEPGRLSDVKGNMSHLSRREFLAAGAGALALGATGAFAQDDSDDGLVVHEWGVLTIPNGSRSVTVRRAGAELKEAEEIPAGLPAYALTWEKAFGKYVEEWRMRPVDKPFVYFYSKKRARVRMRISMPTGRPRAWWPPADDFGPKPELDWGRGGRMEEEEEKVPKPEEVPPKDGYLEWKRLTVRPSRARKRDGEGWWAAARETDAAPVASKGEREQFVFYDAFVRHEQEIEVEWKDEETVRIRNASERTYRHLFALRVRNGKCAAAYLKELPKGEEKALEVKEGAPEGVADALVSAGLYRKEAEGLLGIWKTEFFRVDGARVLAVLPPETVEGLLPMKISPAPKELKRILVAQIECLTPARRKEIRGWIEQLGSPELEVRTEAWERLRELGPLADGEVRKALEGTDDAEIRARLKSLLGE